jgi:hypothetical protein
LKGYDEDSLHWDKWIAAPSGCFIWCGAHKDAGYGMMKENGKAVDVHRRVCEKTHGPRASFLEMEASHLCHEPRCIRSEHLVWETRKENFDRTPQERRSEPPRGQRGRNAPPYTLDKSNPKRPYWVRVTIAGRRHTVGYFTTPDEAIAARAAFLETQSETV